MARIESGKASLKIELGSYSELIHSLNAVFEPSLKSKNLSLSLLQHGGTRCPSSATGQNIREILLNIISNSIKYTPEGGKISVKIEETPEPKEGLCLLPHHREGQRHRHKSKEYLPHIFEEFYKRTFLHRKPTSPEPASGLPIVKSLVNLMGGTIDVESELGAGTITTVCLTFGLPDRRTVCGSPA